MNALDKNRRNFTAWCEDCDRVFDQYTKIQEHKEKEKHKNIKIVEFWNISR